MFVRTLPDNYFENRLDIGDVMPVLVVLCYILICIVLVWWVTLLASRRRKERMAWKSFGKEVQRYQLSTVEEAFLRRVIRKYGSRVPKLYFMQQDLFEQLMQRTQTNAMNDPELVSSIRDKIFKRRAHTQDLIRSTHLLPGGTRLFINPEGNRQIAVWGYLDHVDDTGLQLSIPSHLRVCQVLQERVNVDVTAYVPGQTPIFFHTWIKSILYGSEVKYVLGHATYVVPVKPEEIKRMDELSRKTASPHSLHIRTSPSRILHS